MIVYTWSDHVIGMLIFASHDRSHGEFDLPGFWYPGGPSDIDIPAIVSLRK